MSVYYIGDLEFYSDPREEFEHSGILGMKWGVRRWQYPDGTYTPAGRERYGIGPAREWDGSEEDKQRILKSGSPDEVLQLRGKISNKELQDAALRLQSESNIERLSREQRQRVEESQKNKSLAAKAAKVAALLGTAITLYAKYDQIKGYVQKAKDKRTITPQQAYAKTLLAKIEAQSEEQAKNGNDEWFEDAKVLAGYVGQLKNYQKIWNAANGKPVGGD